MTVASRDHSVVESSRSEQEKSVPSSPPSPQPRGTFRWGRIVVGVLFAGVAVFLAINGVARKRVSEIAATAWSSVMGASHGGSGEPQESTQVAPRGAWNGVVEIHASQAKTIGLDVVKARVQTEAMRIDVSGKTDYDPNTLNKIRPKFKSLIDKVYVEYGQTVHQGDPLVDLFSADLAEAKGLYENKMAQWEHDRAELARASELFKTKAVSEKEYLTIKNDEKKSGTEAKIAKDKLMVFGLSDSDIVQVAAEAGTVKAKMTLRAPASGVVIGRDVVKGNLYDENDVLLTIASLDHFWVYGFVYPSDASRVSLGQKWLIHCPFAGLTYETRIESITSEIDKETKTLRIRTHIKNSDNRIKADMLVNGAIEIPPPSNTRRFVLPRLAMVSVDGGDYAFVRVGNDSSQDSSLRFVRRRLRVIYEGSDGVYVAEGTDPAEGIHEGDEVAAAGSLILMQMFEDGESQ